jgi:hypothetical protein
LRGICGERCWCVVFHLSHIEILNNCRGLLAHHGWSCAFSSRNEVIGPLAGGGCTEGGGQGTSCSPASADDCHAVLCVSALFLDQILALCRRCGPWNGHMGKFSPGGGNGAAVANEPVDERWSLLPNEVLTKVSGSPVGVVVCTTVCAHGGKVHQRRPSAPHFWVA